MSTLLPRPFSRHDGTQPRKDTYRTTDGGGATEMRILLTLFIPGLGLTPMIRQDQDYAKLLNEAKITLAQAVELGIKDSKTPRIAMEAWIEEDQGNEHVIVNGAQDDRIFGVTLDLAEGKVLHTGVGKADRSAEAKTFKLTLSEAIQAALKQEKGQAVRAKFELTDAKKPQGRSEERRVGKECRS